MRIQFHQSNNDLAANSNNTYNISQKLTKCAKMTEEGETIRNGMNGTSATNSHSFSSYSRSNVDVSQKSTAAASELESTILAAAPASSTKSTAANGPSLLGGRLQFFKDGKFILELATSGEGDRSGWVSVPRKTYWPPTAQPINNVNTQQHKNESSTSLSFSDDNSSVQSSPWQRDHCWKQTTPRKNVSSEMTMYYCRPLGSRLSSKCYKTARIRQRRPYYLAVDVILLEPKTNGVGRTPVKHEIGNLVVAGQEPTDLSVIDVKQTANGASTTVVVKQESSDYIDVESSDGGSAGGGGIGGGGDGDRDVDAGADDGDDEVDGCHRGDMAPSTIAKASKISNGNSKCSSRPKLNDILLKLNARVAAESLNQRPMLVGASALVNHSGRIDLHNHQLQQHVSPRKRILRDMEKVSLDDHQSTMKRSRAKGSVNNGHGHIISPPTPSTMTSNHTQNPSSMVSGSGASQQIHFHNHPNTLPANKVVNGIHNDSGSLPPPVAQATSRPISSYSITSLLGHNNNNNNNNIGSLKTESTTTKETAVDHHRTSQLCSPKSPPSFHSSSSTSKPSSAFICNKKKSPTYSGGGSSSLSPIINHSSASHLQSHYNGSSSLGSPVNYGRSRSPDLSPSPDQAYTRYRQTPYGLPPSQSSVSSPNSSAIFHPYLPSSRASPSGALSPPSASTEAHRYRYGSPNHQQYGNGGGGSSSQQSSTSPLAYSRYSPSSAYSQMSPQHYTSKSAGNSSVYNLNSGSNMKGRDASPNGASSTHRSTADPLRDTASSYGGGGGGGGGSSGSGSGGVGSSTTSSRTVPKKTAALRQPYGSPVSSPSLIDPRNSENYYKSLATQSNDQLSRKYGGLESVNLSRSRSPTDLQKQYEKEYRMHSGSASVLSVAAAAAGLSETDAASMIRAGQVPSLQHTPPSMYYMYHPQPAASAAVYYQSLAYAANAFRNPMWLQYPTVHPSRVANPLLTYGGGGGLPTSHASLSTGNHPWGAMSHPAMLSNDAASLLRIKEEPSSDVPLNLSKH